MMAQTTRNPWKNRFFIDTEFTSFQDCHLISVGIVSEDGREFYAERTDFDPSVCSDFAKTVVLPQLGQFPGRAMPYAQIRGELCEWLRAVPTKPKPVLAYDYRGDYDLLCLLLGGGLPAGWANEDCSQKLDLMRRVAYFAENSGKHHALYDARANAYSFR
jgi:hypothetical protein